MPGNLDEAFQRLRLWMRADPKFATTVLTLPFLLAELVDQRRWYRANGMSMFSVRAMVAYVRARPVRFAVGVAVSALPDVVAAVLEDRSTADQQDSG